MDVERLLLRTPRQNIVRLCTLLEGYEGMAVLRTIDATQGLLELLIAPAFRGTVLQILQSLANEMELDILELRQPTAEVDRKFKKHFSADPSRAQPWTYPLGIPASAVSGRSSQAAPAASPARSRSLPLRLTARRRAAACGVEMPDSSFLPAVKALRYQTQCQLRPIHKNCRAWLVSQKRLIDSMVLQVRP